MAKVEIKSGAVQEKSGLRERALLFGEKVSEITIPVGFGIAFVTAFFNPAVSAAFLGGAGLDYMGGQEMNQAREGLRQKRLAQSGVIFTRPAPVAV